MQEIDETITPIDCAPGGAPDLSVFAPCHATLVELFGYWNRKRGDRLMPARADIDPVDLKRLLPLLCLIDVVADARRYVYRLVGTQDVEMRGYDPTGKSVEEAYYGESAAQTTLYLDRIVGSRSPLLYRGTYQPFATRIETDEILFLPLGRNGRDVDMVMLYSHTLWIKDETPRLAARALSQS